MRAFALALILAATPALAKAPPEKVRMIAYMKAGTSMALAWCPGLDINTWRITQTIRGSNVQESEVVRPPMSNLVNAIAINLNRDKPTSCRRVWADFGPNGRLVPGLIFAK